MSLRFRRALKDREGYCDIHFKKAILHLISSVPFQGIPAKKPMRRRTPAVSIYIRVSAISAHFYTFLM